VVKRLVLDEYGTRIAQNTVQLRTAPRVYSRSHPKFSPGPQVQDRQGAAPLHTPLERIRDVVS
jgi:hypothetical protein